ncbi:MAG: helix-turn-helix domain-containing protein [Chlamydiae bacterium]|nr:helix-turn-helix domain-containing protein [Chlamydiota bacterium]MBI3265758.1 helix-turn-helix domain-containing protein [Chlamydiota bacterium]
MDSLGQKLKKAREAKGLSIEEMAKLTKISDKKIMAIEADQYEELPAPIYVRGFLKLFSQNIGLDSKEVLEEYQRNLGNGHEPSKQTLVIESKKGDLPSFGKITLKSVGNLFSKIYPRVLGILGIFGKISSRIWLGAAGGALFIFLLISWVRSCTHSDEKSSSENMISEVPASNASLMNHPSHVQTVQEASPLPVSSPQREVPVEAPKVENAPSAQAQESELVLTAQANQAVWLRIQCDQRLIFEGILKRGAKENWKAKKYFQIRIGKPEAVEWSLNGKVLGHLEGGRRGKLKDIRLTKDGVV